MADILTIVMCSGENDVDCRDCEKIEVEVEATGSTAAEWEAQAKQFAKDNNKKYCTYRQRHQDGLFARGDTWLSIALTIVVVIAIVAK